MGTFHKGFKNIQVHLLDFPEDIGTMGTLFNQWGSEEFKIPMREKPKFIETLLKGKTFPKFILEGIRVNFCIKGISRICLAQLTRDNAIFCSESHGLRPLSMEFNIPLCIAEDESIMDKLQKAQYYLEEAYIEACEKELPYPETRYLGLHAQTINVNASYTLGSFRKACFSRTNNSFCDELNYVYRKMFRCLRAYIEQHADLMSRRIWDWAINEQNCIDDSYYTRTAVFNGDFQVDDYGKMVDQPAHNDWRKSGWFIELKRIAKEEPSLLTGHEKSLINVFYDRDDLPTTYDSRQPRVAKNAIKNTSYYKEHRNDGEL